MSEQKDREEPAKERAEKAPERKAESPKAASEARPNEATAGSDEGSALSRVVDKAWIGIVLMVPGAIIVGMIQGAAAAILVLIAAALITVIALFWSSVRTLFGETQLSGADAYAIAAPPAEEEQKQAVLRALKDLEFERSVGKISDEDYVRLVAKYRADAKRLLRVLDEEAEVRRDRVDHLVRKRLIAAGLAPAEPAAETQRAAGPAAEAEPKKKKKKKAKAEPNAPAAPPAWSPEGAEAAAGRVVIERIEEAEAAEPEKKKAAAAAKPPIDITWKSPLPTKTKESAAYAPATKKCSECGAKNDPDANFCKKCGSKAFEGSGGGKAKVVVQGQDAADAKDSADADAKNLAAEDAAVKDEGGAAKDAAAEDEAAENEAAEDEAASAAEKEAAR